RNVLAALSVYRVLSTNFFGKFELTVVEVDRHHISADCSGDMDSRQSDPATSVHCNPFTRPHLRPIDNTVIGGHEPAAHRSAFEKAHLFGHRYQVHVSVRYTNIASVTTP